MNSSETMHEVKSAAAILADDVICQSFIQSSSTLAYACLLIRRAKYDLAAHVLHSLEAKQASRFKDMVFYLQAQIGIETGEFATIKKRLVPRVHQHANDMVALSLLECAIYHEWMEWAKTRPPAEPAATESDRFAAPVLGRPPALSASPFGNPQAATAAAYAAAFDAPAAPAEAAYGNDTPLSGMLEPRSPVSGHKDPSPSSALKAVFAETMAPAASGMDPAHMPPAPMASAPAVPAPTASASAGAAAASAMPAGAAAVHPATGHARPGPAAPSGSLDGDVGIYQFLANDANTQALVVWNAEKGKLKTARRNPDLEGLTALLPQELPGSMQYACAALEGGAIHKICFCFQHLTVTSFHAGAENMGVITGNINQSLLTIVRAENTFRKQASTVPAASAGARAE